MDAGTMLSLTNVSANSSTQAVLMAAKVMNATKAQGAAAMKLIESASPPPPDGVRGTLVNVMA